MSISYETRPFVQQVIKLLREAAIRVTSLAAQLAYRAHQLDDWLNNAVGPDTLHKILDAILAIIQGRVTHPLLSLIVAEIRDFLGRGWGGSCAAA